MMHMTFWWDYNVNNFLIYGFSLTNIWYFILLCLALLGFSLMFEWIKMLQAKVRQKRILLTQKLLRSICPSDSDTLLNQAGPSSQKSPLIITRKQRALHLISDLSLWICQNIMGYLLMLAVMFYNGYMVIGVIIGSTIGYFLFGPAFMKIKMENCKAMRSTFCMTDCGDPDKTALLKSTNSAEIRPSETSPVCHASTSTSSTVISETTQAVVTN